ncbi:hypothetical protein Tco_1198074 [Tanacetum coccineum]
MIVRQLQALVDKKRVIVTESSIRRDLHFDDAEGTDCLPSVTIFEELARIGAKSTAWNEFSCSMASLIICLATNQKFNLSKYIFDAMVKHLDGGVLDLEKAKDAQAKEIAALKKRVQKLERKKTSRTTGLKRLKKVGMSRRVESSEDQESLGAPEDAFQNTVEDDELMFDTGVLDTDEMHVEAKVDEKDEQSTKLDDSTAGEAVSYYIGVDHNIQAKLDADLIEEQNLARKQEEEANIALIESWENIQAMMEADRLLAERLQSKEREELTDEEKGKLFIELMKKRRKHFAATKDGRGSDGRQLRQQKEDAWKEKSRKKSNNKNPQRNKEWRKTKSQMKLMKLVKMIEVDKSIWKFQEISFNDKDATRNRQRRLGGSLEVSLKTKL